MRPEQPETAPLLEPVKGESISPSKLVGVTFFLVLVVIVPLVMLFAYFERLAVVTIFILVLFLPFIILFYVGGKPADLQGLVAIMILGIFSFAVMATFDVILFWGLGALSLPAAFVHWLGGATVGEIAGLLIIIVRRVFPKPS
jgi:hypothetical protein